MTSTMDQLRDEPGSLWIMITLTGTWFRAMDDRQMVECMMTYVLDHDLGEIDGERSGAGAMDVNFLVTSKLKAAQRLDQFLRCSYPDITYHISDHYKPIFELTE